MPFIKPKHLAVIPLILVAMPAQAYIGPGLGGGAIAAVFGVLASIGMAFVAVVWYPVKRLLKKSKAPKAAMSEDAAGTS